MTLDYLREFEAYDSVSIAINLPPTAESQVTPLELRQSLREGWTVVYLWKEIPVFERPGRWQNYLEHLIHQYEAKITENQKLRGISVNDAILFPDVSDE